RLDRHILIAEKPAEPHFVAAPIRQTAQHARACVHQAAQQQSPLFASRSSPNRPAPQPPTSPAIAAPSPSLDRCRRNHSRFLTRKQIRPSPRTNVCIPKRYARRGACARLCGFPLPTYSTVTLFARLRGWSTSVPLRTATS